MSKSDKKKIVKIMKATGHHAYLATVDRGQPRVRSVSPIIASDMSIWISTFAKSRKVRQIKKNSRVCLHFVKQPNGDQVATVIGVARIIKGLREKQRVWKLATFNMAQYFPDGPGSKAFCLLKIVPRQIEWWASWESGRKIYKP